MEEFLPEVTAAHAPPQPAPGPETIAALGDLIITSWALSSKGSDDMRIPTSHHLLDRALKSAVSNQAYPAWFKDALHFVETRVGLQCVEVPDILDWTQHVQLTSVSNPSYRTATVKLSQWNALRTARDRGYDPEQVKAWGSLLRLELAKALKEQELFEATEEGA